MEVNSDRIDESNKSCEMVAYLNPHLQIILFWSEFMLLVL